MSFEVSVAASAEEGIAELEKESKSRPYQLVVMDWRMPGMDGLKASEVIKRHPSLAQKPKIIIATAYGREEVMQDPRRWGDGFLLNLGQSVLLTRSCFWGKLQRVRPCADEGAIRRSCERSAGWCCWRKTMRSTSRRGNSWSKRIGGEHCQQRESGGGYGQRGNFDVVLMDIQMPVMGGFEATQEIRRDERFKDLPIIAMTAHAMAGDHEKSIEGGMNDHVTKPIDPDQLISALVKWIKPASGDI
jgi:CheY-like chemotaxis protein